MERRQQHSVEAIRDEIIAAAAALRAVARAEQDKQRVEIADWLYGQFIDVADPGVLLEATRAALTLCRLRTALLRGLDSEVGDSANVLMMGRQRPGEGSLNGPTQGQPRC